MAELRELAGVDGPDRGDVATLPTPAVRSGIAGNPATDGTTLGTLLAAAAAILFVAVAGLVAVYRSRRGLSR